MKKGKKLNKKEHVKRLKTTKKYFIIIAILLLLVAMISCGYGYYNYQAISTLKSIEIKDNMKNDDKMVMEITLEPDKYASNKRTWCFLSNGDKDKEIKWIEANNNKCTLEVEDSNYTIYLKNSYDKIKKVTNTEVELTKIKNLKFNKNDYYIAVKGSEAFELNFERLGLANAETTYEISDDTVVKIEDNKFIGLKKGNVTVTAKVGNKDVKTNVHVMSSIVVPNIDTNVHRNNVRISGKLDTKYGENKLVIYPN